MPMRDKNYYTVIMPMTAHSDARKRDFADWTMMLSIFPSASHKRVGQAGQARPAARAGL